MDKKIIKKIVPPLFIDLYKLIAKKDCYWSGNYSSWSDAQADSIGYDSDLIVEKVKKSVLSVVNGKACFERDSVLFYNEDYNWELLSCLLFIASKKAGKLNLIDFGGSLGSVYYQNRKFLNDLDVSWNIVEQKMFVDESKKIKFDKKINFFYDINDCKKKTAANVLLLSSVLQYLEKPHQFIDEIIELNFDYILIDRTPFVYSKDRLTIQTVPIWIYSAKYPCWFFNKNNFLNSFNKKYDLFVEFNSLDISNIKSEFKGFLFKRKDLE